MDLKDIYDELQQKDNLDSDVSYEGFLSLFQNFDDITTIRKDLIMCGYEVVEPVEFFSEILNEIPNLQETEFKKNEIFNFEGEDFLIHTKFSNYTSFTQEIHRFDITVFNQDGATIEDMPNWSMCIQFEKHVKDDSVTLLRQIKEYLSYIFLVMGNYFYPPS
jgi:hypothetical protein